ncbi:fungal-specific transcription factor domain-containing protein [Aspergillus bertholletiae]|uniref:Fungal-specific transcription factor domain-containing protein n=1 Tax=Aspergillus bertholletiae TaxID=1226010 RepID=A0A5N7B5S5_9EURO|nr:fungal-specific transcription factor domain-containing protein [Aspergillus bertholletiae]
MASNSSTSQPKIIARSCLLCRNKKIRCDNARPRCGACISQKRECIYHLEAPRKRPTIAQLNELRRERSAFKSFISQLKHASPDERDKLLAKIPMEGIRLDGQAGEEEQVERTASAYKDGKGSTGSRERRSSFLDEIDSEDEDVDVTPYISVDEAGNPRNFGPSSALYVPTRKYCDKSLSAKRDQALEYRRNDLIANAALQRQSESYLALSPDIAGAPTELALHLLNVHWSRQHHTFLLTYRPAIMRDLQQNGPQSSVFLLNAIFACSSKFSNVIQQQENPFFARCEKLLAEASLIMRPTIPTLVGLLLLGSTCIAQGETSKGWLFTGYALRMVYDLGLNLDPQKTATNAEEIEIRRRVFWGAFVCDKLQSLYLGRPVAINLRDYRVSRELLDTYEEKEMFASSAPCPSPIYSVSTFQQLCLLSKIMTVIINRFYVVGASLRNAHSNLQAVEIALEEWKKNLPPELDFTPPAESPSYYSAPNIMVLHGIYHSLVILLHRPFISDGHLRSRTVPHQSWEKCTSAAQMISCIAQAYKAAYGLCKAPYILSYSIYVACTIHVRNATRGTAGPCDHKSQLISSLSCLEAMCEANPGVNRPLNIIKQLVVVNNIDLKTGPATVTQSVDAFDLDQIFNTFPSSRNSQVCEVDDSSEASEVGCNLDPLFGLMDYPPAAFADASLAKEFLEHPVI